MRAQNQQMRPQDVLLLLKIAWDNAYTIEQAINNLTATAMCRSGFEILTFNH